ncbi:N-acyl-D-amino-acid deacylase family protein [Sphingomonas profundi]|uniref:N-acyl-D-amino-acid deacylase family protein n=1 Tax=Alterirhizorhabdus profundi TaxID=2681549 RepID=UPI0012E93932|nr:amidohydrolase family protein [Sphingomonas profundi]
MYDLVIRGGTVIDGTGAPGFRADVAVAGDRIAAIGTLDAPAAREIDATGLLVTPGWVDIHTHYDGQATWDMLLDPSFSSGVTTAILGNCGVGFAPVRPGSEDRLIELMDGVEEIPGSALSAGLAWNWESFPDFLDVLDSRPRSFDIGALLPHGPLRLYVLGDKVGTDTPADAAEVAEIARLADEAMAAGAFGLSSSRTPVHRTSRGAMTPDYDADEAELTALAEVVARRGGIMEFAPEGLVGEDLDGLKREMALYDRMVARTGVNVHMLVLQPNLYPDYWREQLDWAERITASGKARAFAQVSGRSIGALLSFFGTHPFMERPGFRAVKALPRDAWLDALARPEVKAGILAETDPEGSFGAFLNAHWNRCYDLGEEGDYEPDESRNIVALAAARGTTVQSAAYDMMLETSRHPRLLLAINNYDDSGLEHLRALMERPGAVLGASDAGAHVMTICDGSMNSFMLIHWGRDRRRGPTLPVETIVRMMTSDTAGSIGIGDRGRIAVGLRADLNVIDFERLALSPPAVVDDLPTGASRLLQQVSGYRATIVAGQVTREHDRPTGAMPGRLLRRQ